MSDDSQRFRTDRAYNLHLSSFRASSGVELPILNSVDVKPTDLIGWNYARGGEPESREGVHFFLDDYQFEAVWVQPDKYAPRLAEWGCVCSPDFSLFTDMPYPMQLWNVYRSRMVAHYWSTQGVTVVPTLQWSIDKFTKGFLEGIPHHSTVAVSTVGVVRDKVAMALWKQGMSRCLEELNPSRILHYGNPLDFDFGDTEVMIFRNHNAQRFSDYCRS